MTQRDSDRRLYVLTEIGHERQRQANAEGWTQAHDDLYVDAELVAAAVCYAIEGTGWLSKWIASIDVMWPWARSWWKPADRRGNLIKAGALIVAEIERLDRKVSGAKAP